MPPLNALRAFEAAARHLNFARAAAELHVTPGALSHQIRALEAQLGEALFVRQARGVALSAAGLRLQPGLQAGFALIREACSDWRRRQRDAAVLVLSAPPGFTRQWLAPRLHHFVQAHPNLELRVAASAAYVDLHGSDVDLALRYAPLDAPARQPDLHWTRLAQDELLAVFSPALGQQQGDELGRLPLLHDEQLAGDPEVPSWRHWLRAAGLPARRATAGGLRFSATEHAIAAALQGAGLLLAHRLLVQDELNSARLVEAMPLGQPLRLPVPRAYFLVRSALKPQRAAAQALVAWVMQELVSQA